MVREIFLDGPLKEAPPMGSFVDDFSTVIEEDCDCYVDGKVLFKYRTNVFSDDVLTLASNAFEKFARRNRTDNRGLAAGLLENGKAKRTVGKVTRGRPVNSSIVGYTDTLTITQRKEALQNKENLSELCRLTAFTKNNQEKFESAIPFIQAIDRKYAELAPDHHARQKEFSKKVMPEAMISDTVFSTITCNFNWRTACHEDKGDFEEGLGNLTVVGNDDYEGGHIGFPRFDIGVNLRHGDFIVMNVHEMHCNSKMTTHEKSRRLSFVCYLRKKLENCKYIKA